MNFIEKLIDDSGMSDHQKNMTRKLIYVQMKMMEGKTNEELAEQFEVMMAAGEAKTGRVSHLRIMKSVFMPD